MALSARLNLRQSQSLVMTPQLLQSIRLLQFNHTELQQFIDDQIERNPLLVRADGENAGDAQAERDAPIADTANWENAPLSIDAKSMADNFDASMENVFPDDPGRTDIGQSMQKAAQRDLPFSGGPGDSDFSFEDMAASPVTLRQHVEEQISMMVLTVSERAIAALLADSLDERGYLGVEPEDAAQQLGVGVEEVLAVLDKLQTTDPAGIFARDLAQCLALQCIRRNRYDPAMKSLLQNLDLLANRDFKALRKICFVDETDLLDMLEEIRTLSPHPGASFETSPSHAIIHDVDVTREIDGTWKIELNSDALPKVLVDKEYKALIGAKTLKGADREFMTQCLQDATWLERSLDQRANTILKVATEIVKQQDAFLVHGISHLRPMTMRAIADAIEMHESTVSRVTANKYMMTERGLFEFRFFFTVAIGNTGSEPEHSSESVRQRIRTLIDAEATDAILSDDAIVALLKAENIDIARRTVAKYREAMHISSSVQRRREKRAMRRIAAAE